MTYKNYESFKKDIDNHLKDFDSINSSKEFVLNLNAKLPPELLKIFLPITAPLAYVAAIFGFVLGSTMILLIPILYVVLWVGILVIREILTISQKSYWNSFKEDIPIFIKHIIKETRIQSTEYFNSNCTKIKFDNAKYAVIDKDKTDFNFHSELVAYNFTDGDLMIYDKPDSTRITIKVVPLKYETSLLKKEFLVNDAINIFNDISFKYYQVDSSNVLQYETYGQELVKTHVSSTGGGTNYFNALVGKTLINDTAAILMSRQKVNVRSTNQVIDNRRVQLTLKDNRTIIFKHFAIYQDLLKHFSKNSNQVNTQKNTNINNSEDVVSKLSKLNVLLEKGLISQDDYNKKKESLLALM